MDSKSKKWILVFLILSLSYPLSALTIEKLKSDPDRYNGNVVRLRGEVTHIIVIPFTELSVYILKDRSGSIIVFSSFSKEKDERVSIKAEVVAFSGEENEDKREQTIERMENYLVENEIFKREGAHRISLVSLKIINTIADAATGTWFVIEQKKSGFLNL